jgi:hypothetical protein
MPNDHFRENFGHSMRWEPWVKAIIAQHLLIPATFEEDTQQGTDLRIIKHGDIRIAQRVRKAGYTRNYGDEITFTFGHENGMPCEWNKAVIEKKRTCSFTATRQTTIPARER